MTVYFPLVVHGAMLIEPTETETESKAGLDQFIGAAIGREAGTGRGRNPQVRPALRAAAQAGRDGGGKIAGVGAADYGG